MTDFHGYKNLLITQHKMARVAPYFLKHGLVITFWRSRMQRTRLFASRRVWPQSPLVRAVGGSGACTPWVVSIGTSWRQTHKYIK